MRAVLAALLAMLAGSMQYCHAQLLWWCELSMGGVLQMHACITITNLQGAALNGLTHTMYYMSAVFRLGS
jgi:hypothetical protein